MNEQLIPEPEDFELNDPTLTMGKNNFVLDSVRVTELRELFSEFPNKTLFLALRNREACTPALRQQAISLIELLAYSRCYSPFFILRTLLYALRESIMWHNVCLCCIVL